MCQKKNDELKFVVTRGESNELEHYGVLGMKWGVRRQHNKAHSITSKKKHHIYIDTDAVLTRAGKKQMKKLNKLFSNDINDRHYRKLTKHNIITYSKRKDLVSKILTKTNNRNLSHYNKVIEKNEKEIKRIITDLKSQKVDVVLGMDMHYKQSDAQKTRAKDSKLYKKEGISISRDDAGRITSAKAKDANEKQIKRINQIITNGHY